MRAAGMIEWPVGRLPRMCRPTRTSATSPEPSTMSASAASAPTRPTTSSALSSVPVSMQKCRDEGVRMSSCLIHCTSVCCGLHFKNINIPFLEWFVGFSEGDGSFIASKGLLFLHYGAVHILNRVRRVRQMHMENYTFPFPLCKCLPRLQ